MIKPPIQLQIGAQAAPIDPTQAPSIDALLADTLVTLRDNLAILVQLADAGHAVHIELRQTRAAIAQFEAAGVRIVGRKPEAETMNHSQIMAASAAVLQRRRAQISGGPEYEAIVRELARRQGCAS